MNIIEIILNAISPILRKFIVDSVFRFRDLAKTTENPLDDVIAELLIKLLNIKE